MNERDLSGHRLGAGLPRIRGFGLFIRTKAVMDIDRVEQAREDKKRVTPR